MNRRQFVLIGGVSLVAGASAALLWRPGLPMRYAAAGRSVQTGRGRLLVTYDFNPGILTNYFDSPSKSGLLVLDLDREVGQVITTPFNIHAVEVFGERRERGFGTSKYGDSIAEFDLENFAVVRKRPTGSDWILMGHLAMLPGGAVLAATAAKDDPQGGAPDCALALIDVQTLELRDIIPLPKEKPSQHDCKVYAFEQNRVVTTGGDCLYLVDTTTKTVETRSVEGVEGDSGLRHFSISRDGRIGVQCNQMKDVDQPTWIYGQAEVACFGVEGESLLVRPPEILRPEFEREILDVVFDAKGENFGIVLRSAGIVYFFHTQSGKLRRQVVMKNAVRMVLTNDGRHFAVVTFEGIEYIDATTLKHRQELRQFAPFFTSLFMGNQLPTFAHVTLT